MPYTPPSIDDSFRGAAPSQTRFLVLAALCSLSAILYLDRVCISQALPYIQRDLKISETGGSLIMMAFTLAYGLFEIPTGRWGDRIGSRSVLTRITIWWSLFTALTGACTGFWTMLATRFLFGAGEAGAFPNVARIMSRWFPDAERGRAHGFLLAASLAGGALAPLLAAMLIRAVGWRWTFVVFGSIGVVWAAGFFAWFRDDPAEHAGVNRAEAELIRRGARTGAVHASIPWGAVRASPSIWLLSVIMILASFNSYIYFSWYPKYLQAGRAVSATNSGIMASLVLGGAALGTFFGGVLLDRLVIGRGNVRRKLLGGSAFALAALMLALALATREPWLAAGFTSASCFATQATQPLWWSCATGISGRHVGALFGLMNSAGVFGAMSSQFLVGALADFLKLQGYSGRAQWDPIFYINLGVLLLAALLWGCFVFRPIREPAGAEASE